MSGVTSGDNRPDDDIEEGFAVMLISSYPPGDHGASDCIQAARQGKIIEETSIDEATEQKILYAAVH